MLSPVSFGAQKPDHTTFSIAASVTDGEHKHRLMKRLDHEGTRPSGSRHDVGDTVQFGGGKRGSKLVVNAPDVTDNHIRQYQVGDVVAFDRGNFKLTKAGGKGKGLKWVATLDQPKHTPYGGTRRRSK